MNFKWIGAILVIALALYSWGCEDTTTTGATPGGTVAQVQGKIFDNTTHLPLSGASVYSTNSLGTDSVSTTRRTGSGCIACRASDSWYVAFASSMSPS